MEKNSSNDKLASAHLFTRVCRPPKLKILILFTTSNDISWHFHDLVGNFMTYVQFTKGVEVALKDKLINSIDWCISRVFPGIFSRILRQDFKSIYFSFCYILTCKLINICHGKTKVAQTQFKNHGVTQKTSQPCDNEEIAS